MKITIIGTGYVGLVSGVCFAEMGNDVVCLDKDEQKVNMIQGGKCPIYEPGLEEMMSNNMDRLSFTTDVKFAVAHSKLCFIAVGTPMDEDGSADLQHVLNVARDIGKHMTGHMFIVDKSTVPVGTAEKVREVIQSELDERKSDCTFDIISNPEFLKEGVAIKDFMSPDRVVIGADNEASFKIMRRLYGSFIKQSDRIIEMDVKSAEMTKYAANAMLATKISFINEMANICDRVGANVNMVRKGIGSDSRIGYRFIYPGCGYGGSCFPKDVSALMKLASDVGYESKILRAVDDVNEKQKHYMVNLIKKAYGDDLGKYTFAVWGLAFKPETDDMRQASSVTIIGELTRAGARVVAYDPQAMKVAESVFDSNTNVQFADTKYEALKGADALILVTEWKEFRSPDFEEMQKLLKAPVIFDGRNQYDDEHLRELGFLYYQVGVGSSRNDIAKTDKT